MLLIPEIRWDRVCVYISGTLFTFYLFLYRQRSQKWYGSWQDLGMFEDVVLHSVEQLSVNPSSIVDESVGTEKHMFRTNSSVL